MTTLPFKLKFINYDDLNEKNNSIRTYEFDVTFPSTEYLALYQDGTVTAIDVMREEFETEYGTHDGCYNPDTECLAFESAEVPKDRQRELMERWRSFHENELKMMCGAIFYTDSSIDE